MFEESILRGRVKRFQQLMRDNNIEASMIRTLSSFTYFSGIKWLRPALLIPVDDEPTAFIFEYEAEEFASKTWIKNLKTYRRVEGLMKATTGTIREGGYKVVGFDYSVERDSYVLFFELFKRLNPLLEVRDVHGLIMKLRMIKDSKEIEAIKKASSIAEKGMETAVNTVDAKVTELEIAAEAMSAMMKGGAENPHIYVTSGPKPRVHAEPRAWMKVEPDHVVKLVLAADYKGYYSNMSRTVFLGGVSGEKKKANDTVLEVYRIAEESVKPGVKFIEIENRIREVIEKSGYGEFYVTGFAHGVGLLMEEDPITTIIVPHRRYAIAERMVLASVHAPLTVPGIGAVKYEDTFVVGPKRAEKLTKYNYEITK